MTGSSLLKVYDPEVLLSTEFSAKDDEDPKYLSYVQCDTTKGLVEIEIHHLWAPHGSQRFLELVDRGYYTDIALFRKNRYLIQFGAVKHPQIGERKQFSGLKTIKDDPKTDCFGKCTLGELWDGAMAFAGGGKDSRSDQVFWVHHKSTQPLGRELWETPLGKITKGYDIVKYQIYGGYNEGVDQVKIFQQGTEYTRANFPLLDYINSCELIPNPEQTLMGRDVEGEIEGKRPQLRAKSPKVGTWKRTMANVIGVRTDQMPTLVGIIAIAALIMFVGRFLVKNRANHAKEK